VVRLLLLLALACAGCPGDDDGDPAPTRQVMPKTVHVVVDAGLPDAAHSAPPSPLDIGDYHLDPGPGMPPPRPTRARSSTPTTLHLTLRSTPAGAMAHVDGVPIGVTPAYWEGPAHGRPRDFVFTLRGYAMARYRFVPVTDGVVHGKLVKLVVPPADAGVAATPPAEEPAP
jgi:hypothetical protein